MAMKNRQKPNTHYEKKFQIPKTRHKFQILSLLATLLTLLIILSIWWKNFHVYESRCPPWQKLKANYRPKKLTEYQIKKLLETLDYQRFHDILTQFMHVRTPGSQASLKLQSYIIKELNILQYRHKIDRFIDKVPSLKKSNAFENSTFTNVIGVSDNNLARRLVLACHHDSKFFKNFEFIGATDSAVPCAMLLFISHHLHQWTHSTTRIRKPDPCRSSKDIALQLIFFDGEESFKTWSPTDSLYGARHLSSLMANTSHPPYQETNEIDAINLFVLLDIIGSKDPTFLNIQKRSTRNFQRLVEIERILHNLNILFEHPKKNLYFKSSKFHNILMDDDHKPFEDLGVNILHIIPVPYPKHWHTEYDNWQVLDTVTIENLLKILIVWTAEYLQLHI